MCLDCPCTIILVMQYWLSKHKQKVINKFIPCNFGRFWANLVKSKLRHENNKVKGLAVTCGFGRGRRVFSSWEKKKVVNSSYKKSSLL